MLHHRPFAVLLLTRRPAFHLPIVGPAACECSTQALSLSSETACCCCLTGLSSAALGTQTLSIMALSHAAIAIHHSHGARHLC